MCVPHREGNSIGRISFIQLLDPKPKQQVGGGSDWCYWSGPYQSFYPHERKTVKGGAEIGLLNLRLSVPQMPH